MAVGAINSSSIIVNGVVTAEKLSSLSIEVTKHIQSSNYVPGTSGWHIHGNGNLEANDGTFRGTVSAGAVEAVAQFSASSEEKPCA